MNKKKKIIIIVIAVVVVLIAVIGLASGGNDKPSTPGTQATQSDAADSTKSDSTTEGSASSSKGADWTVGEGTVEVYTNSIGTDYAKIVVPVENTGDTNLYLSSGKFEIEDGDGNLLDTFDLVSVYPQIIRPGETAYYFEDTLYDGAKASSYKLVPHVSVKEANVDCIRLETSEVKIADDDFWGAFAQGRIENTTGEKIEDKSIYVAAVMKDADGKALEVSFTIVDDDLDVGEKTSFKTSAVSSDITASQVASYEVYAYVYQYQW